MYGASGSYKGMLRGRDFDFDFVVGMQWSGDGGKRWKLLMANGLWNIVFAGKDASRALAKSSLKPEDCVPDWYDLPDKEKTVLDEWYQFFSKRYNIVGKVEGATNT